MLLISLLLFMFSCSTNRKVLAIDAYTFEIFFGSTGGFTNINPVFMVKSNGEVLKKDNSSSAPYPLKRISRSATDTLYMLIRGSNFARLKINQISNFTNYIEIKSEKFNNKVMWFNDSQIPVELKKLHDTLVNTIKK